MEKLKNLDKLERIAGTVTNFMKSGEAFNEYMNPNRQTRILNAINDIRDYRTGKYQQRIYDQGLGSKLDKFDSHLIKRIELRENTITRLILNENGSVSEKE